MVEEHRSADRGTADEVPGDGVVALVGVGGSHRSSPLFSERFAEGVNSNDPWALFQWVTMDRPNPSWEALEAIYSDQGPVLKSPPERSVASQRGPLGPEQMVQVLRCPDRGPVGGRRIRRATAQFQAPPAPGTPSLRFAPPGAHSFANDARARPVRPPNSHGSRADSCMTFCPATRCITGSRSTPGWRAVRDPTGAGAPGAARGPAGHGPSGSGPTHRWRRRVVPFTPYIGPRPQQCFIHRSPEKAATSQSRHG